MGYRLNLGAWNSVFAVPSIIVERYLKLAGGDQLKVLLYFLCKAGKPISIPEIAEHTGVRENSVKDALNFWKHLELLQEDEGEYAPSLQITLTTDTKDNTDSLAVKKIQLSRDPQFPPSQIAQAVRGSKEIDFLFKKVEQLYGRPLKHNEQNTLMIMIEETALPVEVALMMVEYCFSIQKATPAYMKALAIDWFEQEINTIEKAESKIRDLKNQSHIHQKLKTMFEMQNAFSKQQKEYIDDWTSKMEFSLEMIEEAYQRTLNGAGKLSFPYMDKILRSWHEQGIKSVQQIPTKQKKQSQEFETSSFDIDEIERLTMQQYRRKE